MVKGQEAKRRGQVSNALLKSILRMKKQIEDHLDGRTKKEEMRILRDIAFMRNTKQNVKKSKQKKKRREKRRPTSRKVKANSSDIEN